MGRRHRSGRPGPRLVPRFRARRCAGPHRRHRVPRPVLRLPPGDASPRGAPGGSPVDQPDTRSLVGAQITLSFGWVTRPPGSETSLEDLVARADRNMLEGRGTTPGPGGPLPPAEQITDRRRPCGTGRPSDVKKSNLVYIPVAGSDRSPTGPPGDQPWLRFASAVHASDLERIRLHPGLLQRPCKRYPETLGAGPGPRLHLKCD